MNKNRLGIFIINKYGSPEPFVHYFSNKTPEELKEHLRKHFYNNRFINREFLIVKSGYKNEEYKIIEKFILE